MGLLADRVFGGDGGDADAPRGSLSDRLFGEKTGDSLIQTDSTGREFLPAREIAARLARLQGTEATREQGLELQRRFQDELPEAELARVGLSRIDAPERNVLDRTTRNVLSGVLDLLNRPSQAVFQAAREGNETGRGVDALRGFVEGLSGRGEHATVFDVGTGPRGRRELFGFREGTTGGTLFNLGAEVVLDPLNAFTFGTSTVGRQGLRVAAREFGEETAEQLARRGLAALDDVQLARMREALGGADQLADFGRTVRGGVRLDLPGTTVNRTLIPSEAVRAPLRRLRIADDTRRSVRRGVSEVNQRTLQTRLRNTTLAQGLRRNLQVRTDLAEKFGRSVADDFGLLVGNAGARSGLGTEQAIDAIEVATKQLDKSLSAQNATDDFRRALGERMVRAFDEGRVDAEIALMRTEGLDDAANTLQVYLDQLRNANSVLERVGDPVIRQLDFGRARGQTPSQGTLFEQTALPRVATNRARRRAIQGGDATRAQLRDITGGDGTSATRGGVLEGNARARRIEGLTDLENALETNPARLVGIQQVQANRALALDQLADEMAELVIDPETGQRLALVGNEEVIQAEAARLGYKAYKLGSKTVWAPPEVGTELTRFNEVVFRNPNAANDFGNHVDKWQNIWKASATVPVVFGVGFHARNLTGNLFNNWLAGGITARHYLKAQNYQRAVKAAQQRIARSGEVAAPRPRPTLAPDPAPATERVSRLGDAIARGQDQAVGRGRATLFGLDGGAPQPTAQQVDAVRRDAVGDLPIFERELRGVAEEFKLTETDIEAILTMRDQGVVTSGFFKTDLHEDAIARLAPEERRNYFQRIYDNPQDAWIIQQGSDIGHSIETNARMAHYLGKIDQGLSPEGAMLSVKKHLFDYSDLTRFERNVMRRVMPFYTFMRFNTPLQFQNFVLQPRKLVGSQRLQEAIAAIGTDQEFLEGKALPQYALDAGDQPLGRGFSEFLGGEGNPVVFGIEFPTEAAFETVEPWAQVLGAFPGFDRVLPQAEDPSEPLRRIMNLPGGGVIEFINVGLEHGLERDLFTGAPVTDHSWQRILQDLAEASNPLVGKAKRTWGDIAAISEGTPEGEARIRVRILRELTGINLTVADPRRQRAELFRRLEVVEQEIEEARRQGIDVPTLTELRDAGLVPEL